MINNILQLPIYFYDQAPWLMYENSGLKKEKLFSLSEPLLKKPGLKTFLFHPILIFINAYNLELYDKAKKYYHQPKKLLEFRKSHNKPGIRDLFIELIYYIKKNKISCKSLYEINYNWRRKRYREK